MEETNKISTKRGRIFLVTNIISLLALLSSIAFLIYTGASLKRVGQRLDEAKKDLENKQTEVAGALDTKIEKIENQNLKLKSQGYVEKDEFSDLSQKVLAATVLVTSSKEVASLSPSGQVVTSKERDLEGAVGTGFLVSRDGYIVTAKHVVNTIGKDSLIIVLISGEQIQASLVSEDDEADLAVLKVAGNNYEFVNLGHDENLNIGDEVGLIGFAPSAGIRKPLIHRGVVSAQGTDAKGVKIFTVNAFINKGNSGGPVFSAKTGRVLGIISSRQRDVSSDKTITLPPGYSSPVTFGGVDPLKLSVDLYNKMVGIVGDVSQVGIGVAYSADLIEGLLK